MASNILPLFWNLASSSKDARLAASVDLVSNLETAQAAFSNGPVKGEATSSSDDEDEDGDEDAEAGYVEMRDQESDGEDAESGVEVDASDDERSVSAGAEDAALDRQLADANAEDVAYTVKRLVRGLASSRESSRLGFAVALTELLSRIHTVSADQIISLTLRNSRTNKSMKGTDQRDALFARLFGLTAIIQSGSLFTASSTSRTFGHVTDKLAELGSKKAWLRESAWWSIILAADGLEAAQCPWKQDGVQILVQVLQKEKAWTQGKLALALRLERSQKSLDWKAILSPTLKHTPILSSQNLVSLGRILRESETEADTESGVGTSTGTWKPQIHFVWNTILDSLLKDGTRESVSFQDFFRVVVDESLFTNTTSPQRRFWGFQIFTLALPRLSSNQLHTVFTPNFMRCWINNLSASDRYLHKAAQQASHAVVAAVKRHPEAGFAVLTRLIGRDGRRDFDKATRSKTVEGVIGHMTGEGLVQYVRYLHEVILGAESQGDEAANLEQRRHWALDQLHDLLRSPSISRTEEWIDLASDILLISGLFKVVKVNKKSPLAAAMAVSRTPLPEPTTQHARNRFFSSVVELTCLPPSKDSPNRTQGSDSTGKLWFIRSLERISLLKADPRHVEIRVPVDEEIAALRVEGKALLSTLDTESSRPSNVIRGIQILLSYAVLHTYGESEDMLEVLESVKTATERMFGYASSTAASPIGTEPAPIDIIIDVLVMLLDKGSADLRSLANVLVGLIAPAFEKSSIDHLVAQLEAVPTAEGANEHADASDVDPDDDNSDVEEIESNEASAEEDDEGDSEDAESDDFGSDLDEDEDMGAVDPAFRKKVEEALKLAGMGAKGTEDDDTESDEEESVGSSDEDEEVWDDDQMMKVDEQLAAVFRERKNADKKTTTKKLVVESVHFKTRILDLFDTFIKHEPGNPLVVDTIVPLLRLARSTSASDTDLASKATAILRARTIKPKEIPSSVDTVHASTVLTETHNMARKAASAEQTALCSSCSIYVARAIESSGASSAAVEVYRATLNEYMSRKQSTLVPTFLLDYVKRYPLLSWPIHSDITGYLNPKGGTNVYRQLVGYSMLQVFSQNLSSIINSRPRSEVLQMIESARKHIYATLEAAAAGEAKEWKADKLKEVLKFACHLARSTKSALPDKVGATWAVDELGDVEERLKAGQSTSGMKGVLGLCAQLRGIVSVGTVAKGKAKPSEGQVAALVPNGIAQFEHSGTPASRPLVKEKKRRDGQGERGSSGRKKAKT